MRPFTNDDGIIIGNYQAFRFTDGSCVCPLAISRSIL